MPIVVHSEVSDLKLSFRTAQAMYNIIETNLPQGPQWEKTTVTLEDAPNEPQTLYYRNIEACALFLAGNPTFQASTYLCSEWGPVHSSIQ
jgi:hypothetical protein